MRYSNRFPIFAVCAMGAVCTLWTAKSLAQELPTEGPVPTTATVRVESKTHAPLDPAMLKLEVNGHQTPIQSITPLQPAQAQVAILIDDGLRSNFGLQQRDLAAFINQLPAGMQVLLGFMRNGEVLTKGFTTDHAAIIDQMRVPISVGGVSGSPYFSLSEFVKHWPSQAPGSRFVLMITNGVDPYNGSVRLSNQDSPYVQTAQEDAERAGVAVYSIYFPVSRERGSAVSLSGQSYLQQVGDATGGESLYFGDFAPVDLKPFFDHFRADLAESYTMQFMASSNREKPRTLAQLKLKTSQPDVKVHAPQGVHPGVAE